MARVLLVVFAIAVTVFALADWARSDPDAMPGGMPKPLWLPLLLLVPIFGPLVWILTRFVARSEGEEREAPPAPAPPAEPVPPDDDPDFLFRLERDIRRRQLDQRRERGEQGEQGEQGRQGSGSGDEGGRGGATGTDGQDRRRGPRRGGESGSGEGAPHQS